MIMLSNFKVGVEQAFPIDKHFLLRNYTEYQGPELFTFSHSISIKILKQRTIQCIPKREQNKVKQNSRKNGIKLQSGRC